MSDSERAWVTSSAVSSDDVHAIGDRPYRMTDEDIARMPAPMARIIEARRRLSAQRWDAHHVDQAATFKKRANEVRILNRDAALVAGPVINGVPNWATKCACRWHSLLSPDKEHVRREYDAHACAIDGDHAVNRAVREVDRGTLARRDHDESVVAPSVTNELLDDGKRKELSNLSDELDDMAQRYALLELT